MVNRLADFDDIQSAFFLLRTSFNIVRATHFMRTTPLAKWKLQAEQFDKRFGMPLKIFWDSRCLSKAGSKPVSLLASEGLACEESWTTPRSLFPRVGGKPNSVSAESHGLSE
jgi:hypothetical protein